MAKLKTTPPALIKLGSRVLGLQSIDPNLVLKNGTSVADGLLKQVKYQNEVNKYNLLANSLAEQGHLLSQLSKEADEFSKTVFDAVKSQFGDDSIEYEKVGGIRRSKRAKSGKKAAQKQSKADKKAAKVAAQMLGKPV